MSELLKEINWNYVWFAYTIYLSIKLVRSENEVKKLKGVE